MHVGREETERGGPGYLPGIPIRESPKRHNEKLPILPSRIFNYDYRTKDSSLREKNSRERPLPLTREPSTPAANQISVHEGHARQLILSRTNRAAGMKHRPAHIKPKV